MIKVKNNNLNNVTLQTLKRLGDNKLDIRLSFKLAKLLKYLIEEVNVVNLERDKLLTKYGQEIEKGKFNILPENIVEYSLELNQLEDIEQELNIEKLQISINSNLTISPNDIIILEPFIYIDEQ